MDLPTHASFGFAIGLVFFGHPEIELLILIGAIIPDLDREWCVNSQASPEAQCHRSLFYNVFVMGGLYLVSLSSLWERSFTCFKTRSLLPKITDANGSIRFLDW